MNLADMLGYADIHQLGRIAAQYGCDCDGHSKNDLIQTILSAIGRKTFIDQYVANMSTDDIRFVATLLFEDKLCYSVEELSARAKQARFDIQGETLHDASRDMISLYKRRGWLFNGITGQTKYMLQVPQDLKRKIGASLADRFRAELDEADEPSVWRDEQTFIQEDIGRFLQMVGREEIPLTADGAIYKRNLLQLLENFSVKEEPVGRVGFRFGYGRRYRVYPDRFSFIYDYCYYRGLICEDNSVLSLTDEGQCTVKEARKDDLGQIYRLWLRLYKGPVPNVLPIAIWLLDLSRQWVTTRSLVRALGPLIKPYYYDSPDDILEFRIIRMLMHLGLLLIGEHSEAGTVVRTSRSAPTATQGITVREDETIRLPIKAY